MASNWEMVPVREAWNKGKAWSQETKDKISQTVKSAYESGKRKTWNKGKKLTKEHKANISLHRKGITAWNKGKAWPAEVKQKISNSKKQQYNHITP